MIRPYRPEDAAQLAALVQRCLREVNSRDYPARIIEWMCDHYSAEQFERLAVSRQIYVADEAGTLVGTVSLQENKVFTMFVELDRAGHGIGRRLMSHIEELAAQEGHDQMEVGASITAHDFYRKLGYTDVRETETEFGVTYILHKPLRD